MLNREPTKDLFIKAKPGPSASEASYIAIDTPFPPIQSRVREARDKAMTTGDRESVAKLCHYRFWFLLAKHYDESHSFQTKIVLEQWIKEFEFPTLKEEMLKLQDAQFTDLYQRPPLVHDVSPIAWRGYINAGPVDFAVRIS